MQNPLRSSLGFRFAEPRGRQLTQASIAPSVPRTTRSSGVSAPRAARRVVRKPAGARSVFVLNGYGGAHGARGRDVASEPDQIRMRDESIVDIDLKVIGRIARASLRHKAKVPRSIIERPCLRDGGQAKEAACGRRADEKFDPLCFSKERFHNWYDSYVNGR
jgi:hypothetical protein